MKNKPSLIDAIISIKNDVSVSTRGDEIIWNDGNPTNITREEIDAKLVELNKEYEKKSYQRNRASAYPSYADQFDTIYHQGIDAWKAEIKKVKDAHPKPSE